MATQPLRTAITRLQKQADLKWVAALSRHLPTARTYLVGGTVRDLLLRRQTRDYDFVVAGVPDSKLVKALERLGHVDFVGRRFGVYKLRPRSSTLLFDIALPRTEQSIKKLGAHRDFVIVSDFRLPIEEDLRRRDFTINAMAVDWKTKELIDPTGGQVDVKREMIRTVGAADERFAEDYIRMLRAVRFACELGFAISPATMTSVRHLASQLRRPDVPTEPIAKELNRALAASPVTAFDLLTKTKLLPALVPELSVARARKTRQLLARAQQQPLSVLLTLCLYPLPTRVATVVARRLNVSAGDPSVAVRDFSWLHRQSHYFLETSDRLALTEVEKNFIAPVLGSQLLAVCEIVSATNHTSAAVHRIKSGIRRITKNGRVPRQLITGIDVIKLGVSGPQVAALLETIREAQLQKKITTRAQALSYLKNHV